MPQGYPAMNPTTATMTTNRIDMTYLVALHGLPRAGKGTVASALTQRGFTKGGFGDGIYKELSVAFGVTEEELRSDAMKRTSAMRLANRHSECYKYRAMLEAMGENPDSARTSRYHLQRWATEYRRSQDPLYWVKKLEDQLSVVRGPIVVDDLRFRDTEYPFLRRFAEATDRHLVVIEILRPLDSYAQHHVSDTRLPFHLVDLVIENIEGYPEVLQGEALNYLFPTGE